MKKYKLIKVYPNNCGLILGETAFHVKESRPTGYIEIDGKTNGYYHTKQSHLQIGCNEIENFPEYWQEVKPELVMPYTITAYAPAPNFPRGLKTRSVIRSSDKKEFHLGQLTNRGEIISFSNIPPYLVTCNISKDVSYNIEDISEYFEPAKKVAPEPEMPYTIKEYGTNLGRNIHYEKFTTPLGIVNSVIRTSDKKEFRLGQVTKQGTIISFSAGHPYHICCEKNSLRINYPIEMLADEYTIDKATYFKETGISENLEGVTKRLNRVYRYLSVPRWRNTDRFLNEKSFLENWIKEDKENREAIELKLIKACLKETLNYSYQPVVLRHTYLVSGKPLSDSINWNTGTGKTCVSKRNSVIVEPNKERFFSWETGPDFIRLYLSPPPAIRPPLGILPLKHIQQERLKDIDEAIERYIAVNKDIPAEWIKEKQTLEALLNVKS